MSFIREVLGPFWAFHFQFLTNVTGAAVQSTSQPQVLGEKEGESRWRGEETIEKEEEGEVKVVQCVCGATSETGEEGSEYVRCEKCRVWLHPHCVSFQSSKHSTFVCIKCLLEEV